MKLEPLENERWIWAKTFKEDYSDEYLVSDLGRCWSFKSNKFVGNWSNDGHWNVCLYKNGKPELIMIGRLILISFGIPIPEHLKDLPTSKLHCMHLDGDSHNNHLENLAWGDAKENANEINARIRKSEAKKGKKGNRLGKHHSAETKRKISEAMKGEKNQKAKPILQYSKDGTFIIEWSCAADAGKKLGIDHSSISKCARGKLGTCGGYIWRYKKWEGC